MRNTTIITLLLIICTKAIPSNIEFERSSYTYSINEQVDVKPKSIYVHNCTISPTPLAGLIFYPNTCSLTGVVTTPAPSTTYTVVTFMSGQMYTGSFSLEIVDGAFTTIKILRTYGISAAYEGFTIKDAITQNVILEVAPHSGQVDNQDWVSTIYLTGSKYIASLYSSNLNYWQPASFLYIDAMLNDFDTETIIRAKYDAILGLPSTYTFNARFAINSNENWHYKMGEVPVNWYGSDMAGWSTGSAGLFPRSINQIQLYKKAFSVSSLEDVAGVVISLRYRYGYIIYLNGHEAARKGFVGDLSTSTFSFTSLSTWTFHQISLPIKTVSDGTTPAIDYITTGVNTIAIGLIAMESSQTNGNFDGAIRLMGNKSVSRVWKTDITSSSIEGDTVSFMDFFSEYSIHCSTCVNNDYTISFDNDRREWISSVVFKLHHTQKTQQPKNVIIRAKNPEDTTWTTLKIVEGMRWYTVGQAKSILLDNNMAYNQYRFENISTGNTKKCSWKLGQIDLRSEAIEPIQWSKYIIYTIIVGVICVLAGLLYVRIVKKSTVKNLRSKKDALLENEINNITSV